MIEVTEQAIKDQAKTVFNLGIEVNRLKNEMVGGITAQMKRMEEIVLLETKVAEEQAVLDAMVSLLARHRASARCQDMDIPSETAPS